MTMPKDSYCAAIEKLTPTDVWRAQTLAFMQAAQDTRAAQAETDVKKAKSAVRFAARKWALPAAAAVVLLAVPALYMARNGAGVATTEYSTAGAADGVLQQVSPAALLGDEAPAAPMQKAGSPENMQKAASGEAGAQSNAAQTCTGTVTAQTATSLTLQLADGTWQTYYVTADTAWPDGTAMQGNAVVLTLYAPLDGATDGAATTDGTGGADAVSGAGGTSGAAATDATGGADGATLVAEVALA